MQPNSHHNQPPDEDQKSVALLDAMTQQSLSAIPKYRYTDLSRSSAEVLIEYEGQIYRLRKTRNGKLILIK